MFGTPIDGSALDAYRIEVFYVCFQVKLKEEEEEERRSTVPIMYTSRTHNTAIRDSERRSTVPIMYTSRTNTTPPFETVNVDQQFQ